MSDNTLTILMPNAEWAQIKEQALMISRSGLAPKSVKTPEQVVTIAMMGYELGLSPMTALNNISVINGKPTLEAKLMLALVFQRHPQAQYRIIENTENKAIILLGRANQKPAQFCFTIDDAKKAGLLQKDNWKKYPKIMLFWRVVAIACRSVFPDVLTVCAHTKDEIETITVRKIEEPEVKAEEPEVKAEEPEVKIQSRPEPQRRELEITDNDDQIDYEEMLKRINEKEKEQDRIKMQEIKKDETEYEELQKPLIDRFQNLKNVSDNVKRDLHGSAKPG